MLATSAGPVCHHTVYNGIGCLMTADALRYAEATGARVERKAPSENAPADADAKTC